VPPEAVASGAERRDDADSADDHPREPVGLHGVTIIPAVQPTGVIPQWLARPIAVGGLVFFVDALLYFAYRYGFVFDREQAGPISARAVSVDVILFTIFALHHSIFARDIFRKHITRSVGTLERSTYVWIASALFIAICAWWRPIAGAAWHIDQPLPVWTIRAAQFVGVWLTLRSALVIDFLQLAGLRQILAVQKDPPRATEVTFRASGPYGWVRHPIYSGWFLMVFAVPVMTMTRFVFALTSSVYLLIAIPLEERSLRLSSNGAYDRYMREVRWKLLPRIF
jgi:protein-S-isoprenylcysteine O-methyltransferase Ste14